MRKFQSILVEIVDFTLVQSNLVNSMSSELEVLFRITISSNYREVDIIRIYNPLNNHFNISFGRVKETPQGGVSFTHPKHIDSY